MRVAAGFPTLVTACSIFGACTLGADAPVATPFELDDSGGIVLSTRVEGLGPFRFIIDTGSTHSAVSQGLASRVGARAVAKTMVGSALGATMRPVVRIGRLEIRPVVARDLMPSVLDSDAEDAIGGLDGVIGLDVLAPLRYTIDFRQRQLVWSSDAWEGPSGGVTLPLETLEGRFAVSLPQARFTLRLVLDSGAGSASPFPPAQPAAAAADGGTWSGAVDACRPRDGGKGGRPRIACGRGQIA